ncbi:MAG: hypothetical protein ABJH07_02875 [Sedimentitalea sp.]|uniref:hypothetical protein n=1 Tax=Sedimentitalea sp. TaxID=2048915 RepID=UPI003265DBCB
MNLTLPENETGVLRLFSLNMPPEQVKFLREPGALDDVLGVTGVDIDHVEIFPVSDLDELGLPGYLNQGHAIPADQIDPVLADTTGNVLIVHSRALGGRAATLKPAATLVPLGTYSATPTNWTSQPEATPESAKRRSGSPQSPRAARTGARRIGGGIFLAVMLLVVFVIYLVIR